MIRSDFLALLKKHTAEEKGDERWGMNYRHLRFGECGNRCCPLTYVCWKEKGDGYKHSVAQFGAAGRALGLPSHEIDAIMYAADGQPSCDWSLRAALLEAVGLGKEVHAWMKR